MKRLFQIIKKKKHKRLLSAMWVFLIATELFCPVFCDEPVFAAQQNSPSLIAQSLSEHEESAAISDSQSTQEEKVCNDECLCHATPIISIAFLAPEKTFFSGERIAFSTSSPYFNSLSPPHQPPKIS